MQRIEYRTIDKSQWGDGPWQNEPDKIQWQDEETGYPCLIKRHPHLGIVCGYVGVNPSHPLYGKGYDDVYNSGADLDVHGGLTYAAGCSGGPEEESICHVPAAGEPDHAWWFGFDCGHAFDRAPKMLADMKERRPKEDFEQYEALCGGAYRDIAYVTSECQKLAKQLKPME